jgi:hypothetical protein
MVISEDMQESVKDEDIGLFFLRMSVLFSLSSYSRFRKEDLTSDFITSDPREIIEIMKR